jgi:hypothetical protein
VGFFTQAKGLAATLKKNNFAKNTFLNFCRAPLEPIYVTLPEGMRKLLGLLSGRREESKPF